MHNQNVHVAIVVEIPKRTTPTRVCFRHSRTRFLSQLFERTISQVAKHGPRALVWVLRQLALKFWVNIAGHDENIRMAVIVEINYGGPPTNVSGFDREERSASDFIEIPPAIVVIKAVGIVRKV